MHDVELKAVDDAARKLWLAYRDLSDATQAESDWNDDDLRLWGALTVHRAVRDRVMKWSP